jgi:cephalosporin-C deacetylase-like acetyl esterase
MHSQNFTRSIVAGLGLAALFFFAAPAAAQSPLDLWPSSTLEAIRDRSTLNLAIVPNAGYTDVWFDSEAGDATWADSGPPYAVHTGGTIRIHGYLAVPPGRRVRPALLVAHGHGGQGNPRVAERLARLGYVAFSIDGPNAGQSTGGPQDTTQAWISVERAPGQPQPDISFLYHWAYAGMRALTALDEISRRPGNPFHIDASRLGVVGTSMGGMLVYYVNAVDDRVKAAVAISAAGDWPDVMMDDGSWLYHALYYNTRNGLPSGVDALNAVATCSDSTLKTFLDYFDPIRYAPFQHAPILMVDGSHDGFFPMPSLNVTADQVRSAGTDPDFASRLYVVPDGGHLVVDGPDGMQWLGPSIAAFARWLRFAFDVGSQPPQTPTISMSVAGGRMIFHVAALPGGAPVVASRLNFASRIDITPGAECDFLTVPLAWSGSDFTASLPIGQPMPCGPPLTPENAVYFASANDAAGFTVSSKMYYQSGEMTFQSGFTPTIAHWPWDALPVPSPPACEVTE